jgi:amino acid transporter
MLETFNPQQTCLDIAKHACKSWAKKVKRQQKIIKMQNGKTRRSKLHHQVITINWFKKWHTEGKIHRQNTLTDCIIILLLFLSYTDWSLIAMVAKATLIIFLFENSTWNKLFFARSSLSHVIFLRKQEKEREKIRIINIIFVWVNQKN